MLDLTCARCGGSNVAPSQDAPDDDDDGDDQRIIGWCDDCGDYRPLEE